MGFLERDVPTKTGMYFEMPYVRFFNAFHKFGKDNFLGHYT
jgi:hypothetical protein